MCKIPKIGDTVYVIYAECIFVDKVFAVGEKEFILESFRRNTREDYWLCRAEDKYNRWFDSLSDAKEKLMSSYNDDYELVQYDATWYEVEKL